MAAGATVTSVHMGPPPCSPLGLSSTTRYRFVLLADDCSGGLRVAVVRRTQRRDVGISWRRRSSARCSSDCLRRTDACRRSGCRRRPCGDRWLSCDVVPVADRGAFAGLARGLRLPRAVCIGGAAWTYVTVSEARPLESAGVAEDRSRPVLIAASGSDDASSPSSVEKGCRGRHVDRGGVELEARDNRGPLRSAVWQALPIFVWLT